jgi:hypothetical protein
MSPWQKRTKEDELQAAWQELAEQAAVQAVEGKPWLLKLLAERGAAIVTRYALWRQRLRRLRPGERKRLQRRLGLSLAGAALALALMAGPAPVSADTIAVDGATCTLADAITAANTNATTGGCTHTGAGGADTLNLTANVTLTASNKSTYGPTGLPVVTSAITIEGNGNTISRSAATDFRIYGLTAGVSYFFALTALDTNGNESLYSNEISAIPEVLSL